MARLRLIAIGCEDADKAVCTEELAVAVNGKRVGGVSGVGTGLERWLLPCVVGFGSVAQIDLWSEVHELIHLGRAFAYSTQVGQGEQKLRVVHGEAAYTLIVEVV